MNEQIFILKTFAPSDDFDSEANFSEFINVEEEPTVEDEGGLLHFVVDGGPVDVAEFFPFGRDDGCFGIGAGVDCARADGHLFLNWRDTLDRVKVKKERVRRTFGKRKVRHGFL